MNPGAVDSFAQNAASDLKLKALKDVTLPEETRMFRHELSDFLRRVLDAVDQLPDGVMVDGWFEPDPRHLAQLAEQIGADEQDIREAVMGLEARDCLTQETIGFPGIETVHFWKVHPQLRLERRPRTRHERLTAKKDY